MSEPDAVRPLPDSIDLDMTRPVPERHRVAALRNDVADEIERLAALRAALEQERHELEARLAAVRAESTERFAGVAVTGGSDTGADLFGPATSEEVDRADDRRDGLFGRHGARLVAHIAPDVLAAALDGDDDAEDARFKSFLEGDAAPDKSRDWLLKPDTP